MNPYVSVTLAMCVIVLLSLIATAYMAMYFNKRVKADLQQAMSPLSEVVEGELDLEDAVVKGRFSGHIAEGRMATSIIGAGRVFHTSVINGAGGSKWAYYSVAAKSGQGEPTRTIEADDPALENRLAHSLEQLIATEEKGSPWVRIEYDPAPGHIRLTKPMRTRHDIPNAETFRSQLETVVSAAQVNRAVQHRNHDYRAETAGSGRRSGVTPVASCVTFANTNGATRFIHVPAANQA